MNNNNTGKNIAISSNEDNSYSVRWIPLLLRKWTTVANFYSAIQNLLIQNCHL